MPPAHFTNGATAVIAIQCLILSPVSSPRLRCRPAWGTPATRLMTKAEPGFAFWSRLWYDDVNEIAKHSPISMFHYRCSHRTR